MFFFILKIFVKAIKMENGKLFLKFQKLPGMFLEFEKEYNAILTDEHTTFIVEIRKEEFW